MRITWSSSWKSSDQWSSWNRLAICHCTGTLKIQVHVFGATLKIWTISANLETITSLYVFHHIDRTALSRKTPNIGIGQGIRSTCEAALARLLEATESTVEHPDQVEVDSTGLHCYFLVADVAKFKSDERPNKTQSYLSFVQRMRHGYVGQGQGTRSLQHMWVN